MDERSSEMSNLKFQLVQKSLKPIFLSPLFAGLNSAYVWQEIRANNLAN